ncbi:glycosyltransferase family 4 protein [Nitrosococcus wardiae]|uniref:Glycosyltransferase n=1 Tax=Nitrosococcus wardiae TaxID=1814290 RepID=A0A4P7C554_9GAMM|nr:glycosyltransferase family 4 protein [Nitrosococcus wardiae]QBQ55962.1 glycosyltransferase [Nitrosococcus wardiae]
MRVANIIEEGRLGGPQIRIANVASRLQRQGVDTIVFLPSLQSGLFQQKLKELGIHYVALPIRKLTKKVRGLAAYIIFLPYEVIRLYIELRRYKVQLVHCSGGAWQYKGIIAGRLARAKIIWHLNDTSMPVVVRKLFSWIAWLCADGFIVAGERVREYYARAGLPEKPIFEIQAPVDTSWFDPAIVAPDESVRNDSGFKLVSVGNLSPVKGFEYALEAVSILNAEGWDVKLYIAGAIFDTQGAYERKLRKLMENCGTDKVQLLGMVEDVRSILAAADVYVCSSIKEASPIGVWEAMSMGKPIVATDVGDIARFVKNGDSGLIVSPQNSRELAKAIKHLMNSPKSLMRYGNSARRVAIRDLDIEMITQLHLECYRAILSR